MPEPKTADEGLAEIVLIYNEMRHGRQRLVDAITPVVKELNDLRLENEKLTAALHRKSEDRH